MTVAAGRLQPAPPPTEGCEAFRAARREAVTARGEAAVAVSIVVRSKNDAAWIGGTLDALSRQTRRDFELLSVDSGSTDATPAILARYDCRRYGLPAERYVPGAVLNWMAREARGDLLVFLNSDATPVAEDWLEQLLRPFAEEGVAGVYGRQLPRPGAPPWVERDHAVGYPPRAGDAVPHLFSLANSAIRKRVWRETPFDERLQYSEDEDWAHRVHAAGWRTAYVPEAAVVHSHDYSIAELRRRFFGEGRADAAIYGPRTPARLSALRLLVVRPVLDSARDARACLARGELARVPGAARRRWVQHVSRWRGLRRGLAELRREVGAR